VIALRGGNSALGASSPPSLWLRFSGFFRTGGDLIWKSFIDTGIAVAPYGSDDHLIKVKCLQDADIRPDFAGWEAATTTHALQRKRN